MPPTGSIGDCYDNGVIEGFWSRMQIELLGRDGGRTCRELATAIFEEVEIVHKALQASSSDR